MRLLVSAAVALTLALAAVGASAANGPVPSGPDPATAVWTEWPHRVSCGYIPFDPVVAFSGPTNAERADTPAAKALRRSIREFKDFGLPKHHWRILAERPGRMVEYASGRLPDDLAVFSIERSRGGWRFGGFGGCDPSTLRRGDAAITWNLAADQPQLHPGTRSVLVHLGPGPCAGGRSQNDRLMKPEFREQNGALLITLWLRPLPPGGYTCQGLVEPPVRIRLPEPLGDRELYDGGTYPPRLAQLEFGR